MDAELRRFLLDAYSATLYKQALAILYRDHGVQMRFTDETTQHYRSDKELKDLEQRQLVQSQKLARELVDELDSAGFHTEEDFVKRKGQLKLIVDEYIKRLIQRLR